MCSHTKRQGENTKEIRWSELGLGDAEEQRHQPENR
jgi:hypothetical protein